MASAAPSQGADGSGGEGAARGSGMSPLALLSPLSVDEVVVAPAMRHVEIYTPDGLLGLLWHGPEDAAGVVVLLPGGMGGFLGPARGLWHELGVRFADRGIGTIRVDYRRPGRLEPSLIDVAATVELGVRAGARHVAFVGHSFGGAVAVQAGTTLGPHTAGVVTLATQSAGCECAGELGRSATPLLLVHGDRDEILAPQDSAMVREMAGTGELEILPGAGHGLTEARDHLVERLLDWIPARLADHAR